MDKVFFIIENESEWYETYELAYEKIFKKLQSKYFIKFLPCSHDAIKFGDNEIIDLLIQTIEEAINEFETIESKIFFVTSKIN